MSSRPSLDRKILLKFHFKEGQSVTVQTSFETADDGRIHGFSVTHPMTGQKLLLSFLKRVPDFKRGAIIYEFIET